MVLSLVSLPVQPHMEKGCIVKYQQTENRAIFPKRDDIVKKVYDNCRGIDVHKKRMVACFIRGKEQEVREFGATTREFL